jgi:adenylate cyclase
LSGSEEVVPESRRQLAAIMFTDLVGYTALTQKNEALAMELLEEHRKLLRPFFTKHNGKEIKTIGDAFLVEFASALEAIRCAFDIQQSQREINSGRPPNKKIQLRIGIHVGDVIHQQNDVYGDAVNVASRIEPLAMPGGICVTRQVYDHIKNKFEFPLSSLGKKELKNVSEAIEVYRVTFPWETKDDGESALDSHRVAVLPFVNMSPDPHDEFFADGLTEELIDRLSQVRELEVIARTSIMSYKKKEKKAAEIGRELRVGALVEGSVRKAGIKVRITAQLINANTEAHLWSSRYDRDLEDIFAVQSDIASKVSEELRVQLVDSEKRKLQRRETESTEAYTNFLRGRELLREGSESSLRQAVGLFERAVELDPSFARAYSGLAACYQRLGNDGYDPWEESIAKAKVPLTKALDLDPDLAEAHAALSVMSFNEDDLPKAEAEARRAIELNPSLPEAYESLGNVMATKGAVDETVRLVETYYRLDPIRPSYVRDLGMAYFYSGRESEALQHWERTAQLAPAGTYRVMAEYYLSKGNYKKARELHSMVEKLQPTNPWVTWVRGFMAAQTGDRDAALQVIREIEESRAGALSLNDIGFIYYALGDLDSYFDYLNRALDHHALYITYPMYCPLFEKGRADPRYEALLERMRKMSWPAKQ